MNTIITTALHIGFFVITGAIALLLALCVYIYIRYGRTRAITVTSSLVIVTIFLLALVAAYATLQNIISLYA